MKPIYERLTKDDILKGCLGGYTQNNREAINHLVWARCPKTKHSGRDHLDAAVARAVVAFNDGSNGLTRVLMHMGIEPGTHMMAGMSSRYKKRKRESNMNAFILAKKILEVLNILFPKTFLILIKIQESFLSMKFRMKNMN